MFDMMGMLGKMKDFQANLQKAQESLGGITASAEAGAGMVKATVNGRKELISIEIDPDLLNPKDAEMVQDLVVAATNMALRNIEAQAQAHLQKATEGMLPNIPGMPDLGSFLK